MSNFISDLKDGLLEDLITESTVSDFNKEAAFHSKMSNHHNRLCIRHSNGQEKAEKKEDHEKAEYHETMHGHHAELSNLHIQLHNAYKEAAESHKSLGGNRHEKK